ARTKAREEAAVAQLNALRKYLREQRRSLEDARTQQQQVLAKVQSEQVQVESQLQAAQQALDTLEAYLAKVEEAQKAHDEAMAVARAASNRSTGGGGGGGGAAPRSSGGIICPVRGPVSFVDSFGAPRHQGPHQGVDLMAARGTPDVAVVNGTVTFKTGSTSGNGAYLSGDNGTLYYYFHLDHWEGAPRRVAQGEVIGYVGNTGDARYTATHTHFEIHPGHGAAVDPYPYVRAVC